MSSVIQETLTPPIVEGLVGHTLDLDLFPDTKNVRAKWPEMQRDDEVQLSWTPLATGEGHYQESQTVVLDGSEVEFSIPREDALRAQGRDVLLQYTVIRNDEVLGTSPSIIFLVAPSDVAPEIDGISEEDLPQQPIESGGSTGASAVVLTGRATPNQLVQIFDNDALKGSARVNDRGIWSFPDSELQLGGHSYVAKAMYGSNYPSAPFAIIRVSELTIDHSVLVLDGVHVHPDPPLSSEWIRLEGFYRDNVSVRRTASGGKPPYRYASLSPEIASVDQTGLVTSQADGATTIEVRDDSLQSTRFTVTCANNFNLHASQQGTSFTFDQALEWLEQSPLNFPIPHLDTPLGNEILRDMQNHRSHAAERYHFHTATVNPGSTDLTNLVDAWSLEEGGEIHEIGPVGLDRLARAICLRDL